MIQTSMSKKLQTLIFDHVGLYSFHSIFKGKWNFPYLKKFIFNFRPAPCREKMYDSFYFLLQNFEDYFPVLEDLTISLNEEQLMDGVSSAYSQNFSSTPNPCYTVRKLSVNDICIREVDILFRRFPHLVDLKIDVHLDLLTFLYPVMQHLTSCHFVFFSSQFERIMTFLESLNQLERLIIDIRLMDTEGFVSSRWRYLIQQYLPKLQEFHLLMITFGRSDDAIEDAFVNDIHNVPFWVERQSRAVIYDLVDYGTLSAPIQLDVKFPV